MENWEQINAATQMQRYIEEHLNETITLHTLAQVAGYSPWHCAKFFKEYTGKAPFEYIRMCRLSKAALNLRDHNLKIVDVAMDFMFDSHEGFSRAFHKLFGITPKDYKKNTPPIYLFHPWPVREYYYWLKSDEYDPTADGYAWTDNIAPRFQLAPQGWRGYIEARPVRKRTN